MSAHIADSEFSFRLPSLSYIDAKWEEPNLRTPVAPPPKARQSGIAAWLSRRIVGFQAWRRNAEAASELAIMSDRELMDIGISRSDLRRVFDPALNQDLRQRG